MTLLYLVIIFHLPVWRFGYRNHKYRFSDTHPKWMRRAISIRNKYQRENKLIGSFYWAKFGRLYIRDNYSMPDPHAFKASRNHLFVWKRAG